MWIAKKIFALHLEGLKCHPQPNMHDYTARALRLLHMYMQTILET